LNADRLQPLILNVNDRDVPSYVTEQLLRTAGFEVRSVTTGRAALQFLDASPDLILLDVHLPDMDGFEVCRALKSSPSTSHIPVLLSSAAFVTSQSKVAGLDSGADGYLVQPFEPPELIATVRALLRMKRAEREARDALRLRDEFLSVASHELRTPITAVNLNLESLVRSIHRGDIATAKDVLDRLQKAQRGIFRLQDLIESILDLSRLENGQLRLQPERVNLGQLVQEVAGALEEEIRRSGCNLTLNLEEVEGLWDRTRLQQIVVNLLTNALKYAPGCSVQVSLHQTAGSALLAVRDEGAGIASNDQARIFERFERSAVSRNRPGFGVGLWIVRQVAQSFGGDVTVESELGAGATFKVFLPTGDLTSVPVAS